MPPEVLIRYGRPLARFRRLIHMWWRHIIRLRFLRQIDEVSWDDEAKTWRLRIICECGKEF